MLARVQGDSRLCVAWDHRSVLSPELGSKGRDMSSHGLRISSHKPLRLDAMVLPPSRKGSSSGRIRFLSTPYQVGLAFLPAVTPEPMSPPFFQALLTHPCCCHWLLLTYSVPSAGSSPIETLLGDLGNREKGYRKSVLLVFK